MLYRNRARRVCFIYREKCVIVLPYSFLSHSPISFAYLLHSPIIYEVESIHRLIWFLASTYFSFLPPSFSYYIWSWINPSPYSVSCIHLFLFPFLSFPFLRFRSVCEVESIDMLIPFLASTYFSFLSFAFIVSLKSSQSIGLLFFSYSRTSFFPCFILIYNIKSSQSICWFVFLHSPTSLTFCLTSYIIPNCVNVFANSFSPIQLFDLSCFHFHITYEGESMDLLMLFQSITSLIFQRHHLPLWSSIFSFMMVRMNILDVSDTVILFLVSSHKSRRKYEILLQNIFLFFTHSTLLFVGFSTIFHEWKLSISHFVDVLMATLNSFCLSPRIFVFFFP